MLASGKYFGRVDYTVEEPKSKSLLDAFVELIVAIIEKITQG